MTGIRNAISSWCGNVIANRNIAFFHGYALCNEFSVKAFDVRFDGNDISELVDLVDSDSGAEVHGVNCFVAKDASENARKSINVCEQISSLVWGFVFGDSIIANRGGIPMYTLPIVEKYGQAALDKVMDSIAKEKK